MPQPKKPNLQPDPVVEALVSDPAQGPPGTTVLSGFLGKSPIAGVWRLYLTATLDEYVEIPESDIQHSETLPDASGTNVWVINATSLKHVRTQTQDVQAEFLGGAITDEMLAGAATAAPTPLDQIQTPAITFGGCPTRFGCPSFAAPCLSRQIRCNSAVDACPTRFGCPTQQQCPSFATPCLSQQIRCNSAVDACPSRFGPCVSKSFNCPTISPRQCVTLGIACIPTRFTQCPTNDICPTDVFAGCGQVSQTFVCPSTGPCPSLAGCPTEGFCGDPFDPGTFGGGGQIG